MESGKKLVLRKKMKAKVNPLIMINWDEIDKECGLK